MLVLRPPSFKNLEGLAEMVRHFEMLPTKHLTNKIETVVLILSATWSIPNLKATINNNV